ncbi:MAG: hypothetical protein ABSB22_12780 [Thermodesulfobacteriota bacterium]|jgi:hypothetical protein
MEIIGSVFDFIEKLPVPMWLWPAGLFAFLLAMLVFHLTLEVRRGSMWKRAAMTLGFEHRDEDTSLADRFKFLVSFYDVGGFDTRSFDVLTGESASAQTWLLDHGSGKPRTLRTACIMRTSELQAPYFHLWQRPSLSLRLRRPLQPEIVFEEDADFSHIFVLSAENPEAVRNLFVPVVREHFKRIFHRCREIEKLNNDWLTILMLRVSNGIGRFEVEASGDTLSVHLSRIINPRGAADFLALTAETREILQREQNEAKVAQ